MFAEMSGAGLKTLELTYSMKLNLQDLKKVKGFRKNVIIEDEYFIW